MNKNNSFTVAVLFLSITLTGCLHGGFMEEGKSYSLNKYQSMDLLIENTWDAFTQFSRQDFSGRISNDFIPDKNVFLNKAEDSFYKATPISLSFTINKVLESGNKISVSLSWKKKVADRDTGALFLIEGEGAIVFINQNDRWLIYKIDEASIFTL